MAAAAMLSNMMGMHRVPKAALADQQPTVVVGFRRMASRARNVSAMASAKRNASAIDIETSPMISDTYGVEVADVTRSKHPMIIDAEETGMLIGKLFPLVTAHFVTAALNVAGRLRIADILGKETLSVSEISQRIHGSSVDEKRLGRILRFLAGHGILKEATRGAEPESVVVTYSLTPLAALLQTSLPQASLLPGLLHYVEQANWDSIINLPAAVAGQLTEPTPFQEANGGKGIWDFYDANPANLQNFAAFMTTFSVPETAIVANEVDWADYAGKTVVDLGGSEGAVISAIKQAESSIRAINFDLPYVISNVPDIDGVEMISGDFFDPDSIPEADVYFMKHILHDWSDDNCLKILKNIRDAGPPDAKLILAEGIVAEPGTNDPLKMTVLTVDIMMMTIGGMERCKAEWHQLLAQAGWQIEGIIPTEGPMCQLIKCRKA